MSRVILRTTRSSGRRSPRVAVARPVREHERGHGRVADRAAVRAAVAEAERARRVLEHLAQGLEVAVAVGEEREHQQLAAVVLEHEVVEHLLGVAALARGDGGDARLGPGS